MTTRRRRHDEAGVTLIELLVVVFVLGIVGTIVMSSTVQAMRATARANERTEALANLERGLERIARELRGADPLQLDAGGDFFDAVTAIITRGNKRVAYRYYIHPDAPDELWETITVYRDDGTKESETPAEFIVEVANKRLLLDLFTYLDSQGNEITCSDSEVSAGTCTNKLVTAEQIKLTLAREVEGGQPITFETVVALRATRYSTDPTDLAIISD